jgi:hypothetical protein
VHSDHRDLPNVKPKSGGFNLRISLKRFDWLMAQRAEGNSLNILSIHSLMFVRVVLGKKKYSC